MIITIFYDHVIGTGMITAMAARRVRSAGVRGAAAIFWASGGVRREGRVTESMLMVLLLMVLLLLVVLVALL